ncbi:hypothetical protein AVEN_161969-1 [Araneus ventricosus]|uniref:Integrase p58-like C-terminal domain-containing protein n=1 Tax=Araneus ventricosus TaxID=182803 RepID=A0A4Y2SYM5_ARAVE|nr:hypothetical protein AVEN_161969-1 [Araneus ventricosus]
MHLHIPKIKIHTSKKLAKFNQGSFRVIKQFSPVIFEIQQVNQPSKKQKVHLNRLIKVVETDTFTNTQVRESPIPEIESVIDRLVTPSEEEILQLYPSYCLPYRNLGDEPQVSAQKQFWSQQQMDSKSVDNWDTVSSAISIVENSPPTTPILSSEDKVQRVSRYYFETEKLYGFCQVEYIVS